MTSNEYIEKFFVGVDQEKLAKGDENELSKFRVNIANAIKGILRGEPEVRAKAILALKEGLFEAIAQIPVITPIVTAMLQVITGEDLGSKIEETINLQKQTINLQKQTINLQKQTLEEIRKLSERITSVR